MSQERSDARVCLIRALQVCVMQSLIQDHADAFIHDVTRVLHKRLCVPVPRIRSMPQHVCVCVRACVWVGGCVRARVHL